MPGIIKASAPAEEEDKPEEPNPRPDEKPEPKDPQPPKPPEDDPKEEEKEEENEQCQYYRNDIAHLKQRLAQTREVLLAQERALRKLEYVRAHLLFTQAMGTVELVGEAASEIAEAFGRRRRRGKGGAAGGPTPPKPPGGIKIPPRDKRPGDRGGGQEIVDVLSDAVETAEVTDSLEDIEQKIKYTEEKIEILKQRIDWYIEDIVDAAKEAQRLRCPIEVPDPSHL